MIDFRLGVKRKLAILSERVQIQIMAITTVTVVNFGNCAACLFERLYLPRAAPVR
jgi:hypothetical protein